VIYNISTKITSCACAFTKSLVAHHKYIMHIEGNGVILGFKVALRPRIVT
jgi:hypothetical protein